MPTGQEMDHTILQTPGPAGATADQLWCLSVCVRANH